MKIAEKEGKTDLLLDVARGAGVCDDARTLGTEHPFHCNHKAICQRIPSKLRHYHYFNVVMLLKHVHILKQRHVNHKQLEGLELTTLAVKCVGDRSRGTVLVDLDCTHQSICQNRPRDHWYNGRLLVLLGSSKRWNGCLYFLTYSCSRWGSWCWCSPVPAVAHLSPQASCQRTTATHKQLRVVCVRTLRIDAAEHYNHQQPSIYTHHTQREIACGLTQSGVGLAAVAQRHHAPRCLRNDPIELP